MPSLKGRLRRAFLGRLRWLGARSRRTDQVIIIHAHERPCNACISGCATAVLAVLGAWARCGPNLRV